MIENKPCPFCGGLSLSMSISTKDREGTPTCIVCDDCAASGPFVYLQDWELDEELPKRALKVWNERK